MDQLTHDQNHDRPANKKLGNNKPQTHELNFLSTEMTTTERPRNIGSGLEQEEYVAELTGIVVPNPY